MPAKPRLTVRHNPDKDPAILAALRQAGYELVSEGGDVLFTDLLVRTFAFRHLWDSHTRVVLYPHGPGPVLHLDGIWPEPEGLLGVFVVGREAAEVTRSFGVRAPVHAIGFPWCELLPFRPTAGRRVLFGAMHPDGFGYMQPLQRQINARVVDILAGLGLDLTVRHIGSLASCGLVPRDDVRYERVGYGGAGGRTPVQAIDEADLVVGYETFGHLAVARGKPTVFFGQSLWLADWFHPGQLLHARTWGAWRHRVAFPYDLLEGDPDDLLARAVAGDGEIAEWRDANIGPPFEADQLLGPLATMLASG